MIIIIIQISKQWKLCFLLIPYKWFKIILVMLEDCATISLRICQEGHANALALNKDANQIAVAGRSLLKIYSIENDGFTEVCNMRGGKNQNLSYSSNDVAWSSLDSNILATAATNGVVSVWDLCKFGRQKQLLVYNDHKRTAHTVTFHSTEPNILISGSQDGTIKCFDTRSDKAIYTFHSNSESVRDVKFSPHCNNVFSAVSENGTVQVWDMRSGGKCLLQQFTAHSGPIYTCDWHPTNNWLATGSRDKQIKVWNMDGKASLDFTIHTIAVVGRVKWRPENTYQIASCALVVDYSIHVWDIRRPFIPFASFNNHTNVTTGISWKGNDANCLLSTSKDSTIYKHAFKDATRPSLKANAQGVSLSRKGDISFANKKKTYASVTSAQVIKTNPLLTRQKSINGVEQFHIGGSTMCRFLLKSSYNDYVNTVDNTVTLKEHECFIGCAKEMLLSGRKLADICEHNANISRKYGKHNATTLWNFIKIFYTSNEFIKQHYDQQRSSFSINQKNCSSVRRPIQKANTDALIKSNAISDIHNDGVVCDTRLELKVQADDVATLLLDVSIDDPEGNKTYPIHGAVILSESETITEITFDNFDILRNGFIYVGPPDFTKALAIPETPALHCEVQTTRCQMDIKTESREKSPGANVSDILKVSHVPTVPTWEPHKFIADALILQSDVGDVQTTLAILIVMGDNRKLLPIEEDLVEHWFQTYVDQLHRYQMWNEACSIINLSWMRAVQETNQKSTTVSVNCGDCGRPFGNNAGWYCQKCKSMRSTICCICGLVVRGLYAWCQGCSHGGHVQHLMEYFSNRSLCPKCGHLCEYN